MRAATYARVSTTQQSDEGYSLDAQEKRASAYAESQGWTITKVFREEGVTGTTDDRPALSDLRAEAGAFDRIIVFKMSRLGRSARDVLNLIAEFQSKGCEVVFLDEGLDTSKPSSKLVITILAAVAEMESDNIRTQVKLGMSEAAAQGRWLGGIPPWGTKVEDGFLVLDEEAAATIRHMATSLISGKTTQEIADTLNAIGQKPPRGSTWKSDNVRRHLRRPHIKGVMEWDGTPVVLPEILDPETWDRVQTVLDESSLPRGESRIRDAWPLSYRVSCSCGGYLIGAGRSRGTRRYRCSNHIGDDKGTCTCDHDSVPDRPRWWNSDRLEAEAWDQVMLAVADRAILDEAVLSFLGRALDGTPDPGLRKKMLANQEKLTVAVVEAQADYYQAEGIDRIVLGESIASLKDRLRRTEAELDRIEEAQAQSAKAQEKVDTWVRLADRLVTIGEMPDPEEVNDLFTKLDVRATLRTEYRKDHSLGSPQWLDIEVFSLDPALWIEEGSLNRSVGDVGRLQVQVRPAVLVERELDLVRS